MSTRKFYKTIYKYEVLSEEPIEQSPLTLSQLDYECREGHWSGRFLETASEELNGKQAADALSAQGSDPEFFQLTEDGNDIGED